MSRPSRIIDRRTLENQSQASDPRAIAFVSAIAGSGKTHVLTQRVKRLLLKGTKPERILCLTFTKAAAANMANRLLRDLGAWVAMDDDSLRHALVALDLSQPESISLARLNEARGIFAKAIETPGGLKIQTIHAFCDALLHQFPFEAGIPANFRELDPASEAELMTGAITAMMDRAGQEAECAEALALETVTRLSGEERFAALMKKALSFRDVINDVLPTNEATSYYAERLNQAFALTPGDDLNAIDSQILSQTALPPSEWPAAIDKLRAIGKTQADHIAHGLDTALNEVNAKAQAHAYLSLFLTDGAPRKVSHFVPQYVSKALPALATRLQNELLRLSDLLARRWAIETRDMSWAFAVLARSVMDAMEHAKEREALLAFDDLIVAANRLLDGQAGDWVRWKLDQGIEHLLIDEAQDTSEGQWRLVRRLSEEFFAGEGATDKTRTLFVVGDDKQSIFSFQGAAPQIFDQERRRIAHQSQEAGLTFRDVQLNQSFRSAKPVLEAVETVFGDLTRLPGVTSDTVFPTHDCARVNAPGGVEIWPLTQVTKAPATSGWDYPFERTESADPQRALAERIARRIKTALECEMVEDDGTLRPLSAGDVLILVRRRKDFFEHMIRALKQAGLPVAGADRLKLIDHIAVMDLMALGDAVLLPEDDLTFACLLKSPLIGLAEDDLFELATNRGKQSLFATLEARADEHAAWHQALMRFRDWRRLGGGERPYDFFAGVLGRDRGKHAFMGRFGREANDVISEFLAAALDYETSHTASLQGFLDWMRNTEAVIKREMEQARDEVRVMTVHNAKGLEAKFVILPETVQVPAAQSDDRLMPAISPHDGQPLLLWSRKKGQEPDIVACARKVRDEALLAEYYRLLYVAMTRAEDRLLIAGYPDKTNEPPKNSWYCLIRDSLQPECVSEKGPDGDIVAWHYKALPVAAENRALSDLDREETRPHWLSALPTIAPAPQMRLSPSRLIAEAIMPSSRQPLEEEALFAKGRGEVLHHLLQFLPSIPPHRRSKVATLFVERQLGAAGIGLAEEALSVLALPQLQDMFGADSLAEVPVAGEILLPSGRSFTLTGRIDRLRVSLNHIDILDYKSSAPPPDGTIPKSYKAQLALYARLMDTRFPDRAVRAYVLWTRLPRLDPIPALDLAAALAAVGPS